MQCKITDYATTNNTVQRINGISPYRTVSSPATPITIDFNEIWWPTKCRTEYNKKLSYRRGTARCVCRLKSCQLPRNSAETTSPEQIEVMKLEGYSGTMCNKHVYSTMTPPSRFHCPIGVINKPTTDRVVDITCIPTTCCGEIF